MDRGCLILAGYGDGNYDEQGRLVAGAKDRRGANLGSTFYHKASPNGWDCTATNDASATIRGTSKLREIRTRIVVGAMTSEQ